MVKANIILLLIAAPFMLTSQSQYVDSIEIGESYRFEDEGLGSSFLTYRWDSITFLGDGKYRVESEALIYEGEIETQPDEEGWMLAADLQGNVFRVEIPMAGGIIFRNGASPESLDVAAFAPSDGGVSLVSEWQDLMPRMSRTGLSLEKWDWLTADLEPVE